MTDMTRREVLAGITATAATTALGNIIAFPPIAEAESEGDEETFASLSEILTGMPKSILAPKTDPLKLNREIFERVNEDPINAKTLAMMLHKFTLTPADKRNEVVRSMVNKWDKNDPDQVAMCFLGRSIILAWYLGAWYEPNELKDKSYGTPNTYYAYRRYSKTVLIPHTVLSPNAYTSSLVWRAMQAHPMGYSNLSFGYWAAKPPAINLFTSPIEAAK